MELCADSWGELCGVRELCKGNCVGSYVSQWVGLRGGAVWVGGWAVLCEGAVCGGMHTSHQMVQPYTHNCLQYSQHKGDSPLPSNPYSPTLLSPPTAAAM